MKTEILPPCSDPSGNQEGDGLHHPERHLEEGGIEGRKAKAFDDDGTERRHTARGHGSQNHDGELKPRKGITKALPKLIPLPLIVDDTRLILSDAFDGNRPFRH
jgi:hypothetical protein